MIKQQSLKVWLIALVIFTGLSGVSFAQNRAINGKVVDQSGQGVIGASVMVVGNSTIGTVTDLDGAFELSVPANSTIS